MLIARIRGTREQLRKLDAAGLRLHRTGVRKVGGSVFEVHGVLEEPEASLLELWGYNVIIVGDVKELLSKRLKPARVRDQPVSTSVELFSSVLSNDGYMEVAHMENWSQSLAVLYPTLCSILKGPNQTWEGRTVSAVHLKAGDQPGLASILS